MTARQAELGQFWIGAKGGLLDKKHYLAMGNAVWLFLYVLRGQTCVDEAGLGIFQYGRPIKLEQISYDFDGLRISTIKKWLQRLRKGGYIVTESHSNHGLIIWIPKAKDKTLKPRSAHKVTPKVRLDSAQSAEKLRILRGLESDKPKPLIGPEIQNSGYKSDGNSVQPTENAQVATPIPKGFITKHLSNYNNASIPSFSCLGKEKSIPQEKSAKEQDARRRLLLRQAEELQRKYPSRKAATA